MLRRSYRRRPPLIRPLLLCLLLLSAACLLRGALLPQLLPTTLPGYSIAKAAAVTGRRPAADIPAPPEQAEPPGPQVLAVFSAPAAPEQAEPPAEPLPAAPDLTQPLVGIYCTHTSEGYAEAERSSEGAGAVLEAALQLREELIHLGIPAVCCETVHDIPNWSASYSNSLESLRQMAQDYPSIEIFIDIHRNSSIAGVNTVLTAATAADADMARLMLIVGSDQRSAHPNWRENLALAEELGGLIEEQQAGLLLEVRVQSGRYNQHFDPGCLLIEVGSTDNTTQQAKASMQPLAAALQQLLAARGIS